ncbi:hypothetical protein MMC13_000143, partial [Lambiella insularis]|nr:hypothetical protein [Lambiella insularis]
DRLIDPYTAPTQWLRIASTAISIYKESWEWIFYDDKSVTMKAMEGEPVIRDTETLFRESNRTNFLHLLQRDGHPRYKDEPWNDDVQGAYESTVSYIGTISQAINDGEVPLQIARRIMGFPILAPTLFTELLEQRQPRALVILAHFFALTVGTTEVWWIGYTGRREVGGIQSILPEEWKPLMKWPIQLADKAWMYRSDRLQNLIRDAVHALYLPI